MPEEVSRSEKQQNAYWDLRGLIGQWREEYGQDRVYTILYLLRIVADLQIGLHCNYEWRLARLEQQLELPAETGLETDAR